MNEGLTDRSLLSCCRIQHRHRRSTEEGKLGARTYAWIELVRTAAWGIAEESVHMLTGGHSDDVRFKLTTWTDYH